jgi:hypothetical protein
MGSLKMKWESASAGVNAVVLVAAGIVALVFVLKILPALIAALGITALLAILFLPYWVPTIIAFSRKHPSKAGILAVNFFFGWTFVGWVLSLAWALSDNSSRAPHSIVVNTTVSPTFSLTPGSAAASADSPGYRVGDS